jgi:LmbE family N-acetylglucosaminyl deacetylase
MENSGSPGRYTAAVIVAHPDDETLWAGGTVLLHPDWRWTVISLCRASDPDRAPKFRRALRELGADGNIGDMDDSPTQPPLHTRQVQHSIMALLSGTHFDTVITHSPCGEYTRHLRHEETAKAVAALRQAGKLTCDELWMFAYEDGKKKYLPRAVASAHLLTTLPEDVYHKKHRIITGIYGFSEDSWEARTTPAVEAFWRFRTTKDYDAWMLEKRGRT